MAEEIISDKCVSNCQLEKQNDTNALQTATEKDSLFHNPLIAEAPSINEAFCLSSFVCSEAKNVLKDCRNTGLRFECTSNRLFNCQKSTLEDYICRRCGFTTDLRIALQHHMKNSHMSSQKSLDYDVNEYVCSEWNFRTHSALFWLKHGIKCNRPHYEKGQIQKCPYCSLQIKKSLEYHIIIKHTPHEEIKWYKCDQCNYKGKLEYYLTTHINSHHISDNQVKTFSCNLCQYKTTKRQYLQKHVRNQHTPPDAIIWHKCDHCDHKTKIKRLLKKHIYRKHSNFVAKHDLKLKKCDYCEYTTLDQWKLNEHITIKHKSEVKTTPFKCTNCEYETLIKRRLRTHIYNKHTPKEKQKWIKCDYCEHKTLTKGNLKNHVINRHTSKDEVRWFNCDHCEFKSKHNYTVKKHVLSVHTAPEDIVWFKCEHCKFRTKIKFRLKSHYSKRHADEEYVKK